jgi:plasmid stabilization system protein ParE
MAYEIIWSESATADLESIVNQLARSSQESALKTGEAIINHVEVLRSFPRIGPCYPRDPRRIIREIVSGKYRVFYRVDDPNERVEILTVWHGARREPSLARIAGGLN